MQFECLQLRQEACVSADRLQECLHLMPTEDFPKKSQDALFETRHVIRELDYVLLLIGKRLQSLQTGAKEKPNVKSSFEHLIFGLKAFMHAVRYQKKTGRG